MQDYITVTEAAYICGVTERTIYTWMKTRGFPKLGQNRALNHLDVLDWVSRHVARAPRKVEQ
jgi:predicted DNA-binding transcriptional regulator AlpA